MFDDKLQEFERAMDIDSGETDHQREVLARTLAMYIAHADEVDE